MRPPPHSRIVIPSVARPIPLLRDEEARSRGTWGFIPLPPLLALCLLLAAAPAATQNQQDQPSCESARAELKAAWKEVREACG